MSAIPSQLEDVIRGVLQAARARDGQLVGITVALPAGSSFADTLRERLAKVGLGGVEVHPLPTSGPPRLVSLEFAR